MHTIAVKQPVKIEFHTHPLHAKQHRIKPPGKARPYLPPSSPLQGKRANWKKEEIVILKAVKDLPIEKSSMIIHPFPGNNTKQHYLLDRYKKGGIVLLFVIFGFASHVEYY
jgi:hypothetical protein